MNSNLKYIDGDEAYAVLNDILANMEDKTFSYPLHQEAPTNRGFFREGDKYVAYDNSTGDCWVEEFKTKKEAKDWLLN